MTDDDYQITKLIRRLERVPRIAQTARRIADSRLAADDARELRAYAATLTDVARDAISLLHALDHDDDTDGEV